MKWNAIGWGEELINVFLVSNSVSKRNKCKKASHLIWLTMAWCICLQRNNVLFNGKVANISQFVDLVIHLSWSGFIIREGWNKYFVFSNWLNNSLKASGIVIREWFSRGWHIVFVLFGSILWYVLVVPHDKYGAKLIEPPIT